MKNKPKIKLTKNFLTVNGKRSGIYISSGPWVDQCDPEMIKIRPKKRLFPASFMEALDVSNDTDLMTDYFASDEITLFPGDELYKEAKALEAN